MQPGVKDMNYYKHYLGDFQRDTGHLSMTERGAYLALIHHYYATETPLPNDEKALFLIAKAMTKDEQKAVRSVMGFFTPVESGLMHVRIEAELAKYEHRANQNKEIAIAREQKRAEARAQNEHEQSTNRAQNVNESYTNASPTRARPITNIQYPTPVVPKGTVSRFPEFWLAWPATDRKTGKAKCEEKWRKQNLDAIAEQVLSHLEAMKQTRKWQEGFEPAPMTFLNGRHWEDGAVVVAKAWEGAI